MGYCEEGMVSNFFAFFFSCQHAGPTYNFKNYCFSKVLQVASCTRYAMSVPYTHSEL